ncbi:hypothetical protein CAPTEDRAFT_223841 [Capitella teleta]|uniref:THO complex subunit 2 n=1 Tax=Capitella teleta TaxID=283909 RepID=R7U5S0_CAPTE|nr:hypothetical protein CAPTEDRAFT_223841 [Capitella teleta]|eukprot:ELU01720.1 hypothetical protein CAPTEDRAFT_223841 [Capitella teleta]
MHFVAMVSGGAFRANQSLHLMPQRLRQSPGRLFRSRRLIYWRRLISSSCEDRRTSFDGSIHPALICFFVRNEGLFFCSRNMIPLKARAPLLLLLPAPFSSSVPGILPCSRMQKSRTDANILSPSDTVISELHLKALEDAKQYAHKMTVVVLGEKDKVKIDDNHFSHEQAAVADQGSWDGEGWGVSAYVLNQKLGLCEALISLGAWEHATQLLQKLPPFYAVSHQPVAEALCTLASHMLDPLYTQQCGLPKVLLKRRHLPKMRDPAKVKQATSFPEFCRTVVPVIRQLGPHLSCDPQLLIKINRLAKTLMNKKSSVTHSDSEFQEVLQQLLTVYDEVLLPSLSLLPNNCAVAEEIWGFIKLLRYEYRYRLYGQWKNESQTSHARLIRVKADVLDRAKYIMKRLAKENVKPLGRQIGKLTHSNPGIMFEYILSQIQRYDNFIVPVVDSLKFLTSLSYDMLIYCIIEALANPEKERMKHDDTNISPWLCCLANFSSAILKKYQVDLAGLIQYVANQLKAGKSFDLLILRELVQKMTGIEITEEATPEQLAAMTGGELLRQEGGYFTARAAIVFPPLKPGSPEYERHSDKRHLKLIGKLYDQCQDTLVQFISFLSLQLSLDEMNKRLPTMDQLLLTYHISPDVAFALWRSNYMSSIKAKFDELRKADKRDKQSQTDKFQRYIDASEHVMKPICSQVQLGHVGREWNDIGLQFYTTFWSLTMYDLEVPKEAYQKQQEALDTQIQAIRDNKDLTESKKKKEVERCTALQSKLTDEEKRQQSHVELVLHRLKKEKDDWFVSKASKHATITSLLQLCLFPRCVFTASDAIYCAKFLNTIHSLKTPNFSSLICYDRIFTDISWALTSCTECEAHRYGRFLCVVLDDLMRWHKDKNVYEKECVEYPGFVTVFRKRDLLDKADSKADHLDYENYRHVCHKWHFSITRAAVACLESEDYIRIRNALIVLIKILPHYPKVDKLGNALVRRIDRVYEEEKSKRPDISALALGYGGQLKAKEGTWIPDGKFHKKIDSGSKINIGSGKATPSKNSEKKSDKKSDDGKKEGEKKEEKAKAKKEASEAREKVKRKERDAAATAKEEPPAKVKKESVAEEKSREKKEGHRPSSDASSSARQDDRDLKRRKVDVASKSSKEANDHDSKKDRKRERTSAASEKSHEETETKHKSEESSINGSSSTHRKEGSHEKRSSKGRDPPECITPVHRTKPTSRRERPHEDHEGSSKRHKAEEGSQNGSSSTRTDRQSSREKRVSKTSVEAPSPTARKPISRREPSPDRDRRTSDKLIKKVKHR